MTIRNRLTLLFTGLIAFILLTLSIYVYSFSDLYTDQEFTGRLEERALLAARVFLEKDELNEQAFDKIQQRFFQALPEEITRIYDLRGNLVFEHQTGSFVLPDSVYESVKNQKEIKFEENGRHVLGMSYSDNQGEYIILTSAIDIYGSSKLENLKRVLIIGFFVGILLVFFLGRYFSNQALHPMSSIVKQVKTIKANNLHLRVDGGKNKDEVAELALTFNNMLARLQSSFESQRTFVRNASHELRTPLAVMIGETEVTLARDRTKEYYAQSLETILKQARQMTKLVNDLLSLAIHENSDTAFEDEVRIDEVLWDIQEEMKRAFPEKQLDFNLEELPDNPDLITVYGNQGYLKRAIGNIVNNALKYSNGKPVEMAVSSEENKVRISVKDQGIGIEQPDLQRIFQPFYRGSNARQQEGHGIGLPLAMSVFQMHNGTVNIESEPGKGTTVDILLPCV